MEKIANYIDGQLEAPASGRYLDNFEPATGRVYSRVPSRNLSGSCIACSLRLRRK